MLERSPAALFGGGGAGRAGEHQDRLPKGLFPLFRSVQSVKSVIFLFPSTARKKTPSGLQKRARARTRRGNLVIDRKRKTTDFTDHTDWLKAVAPPQPDPAAIVPIAHIRLGGGRRFSTARRRRRHCGPGHSRTFRG